MSNLTAAVMGQPVVEELKSNFDTWMPNVLIVGPSGSGKSSSIESLPQTPLVDLILTEPKSLPFSHKFPSVHLVEKMDDFHDTLTKCKINTTSKIIVIDSITKHLERCLANMRAGQTGFNIWSGYGKLGFMMLNALNCKNKIIIALSIDEKVEQEVVDLVDTTQLKTIYKSMAAVGMGKELLGKIEKEFTIVLHCVVRTNPVTKLSEHVFLTKPTPNTTAKSPKAMFNRMKAGMPEEMYIPNDLMRVVQEIENKLGWKVLS